MTVEEARARLEIVAARNREQYRQTNEHRAVVLQPLSDTLAAASESGLYIVWLAAGCGLPIACSNVAGLMLGRRSTRIEEVAIRSALGTRRGALVRQFLIEACC